MACSTCFVRLRLLSLVGLLIYLVAGILGFVAPAMADNPVLREGLDAIKTILILPLADRDLPPA